MIDEPSNGVSPDSYDPVGNRLSSLAASPWNYNVSNQLTSISGSPGTSFTYDSNGNTTSKTDASGTTSYTWDYENRLTQVTLPGSGGTVSFNYDPFGRRIKKSSSTGTSAYAYDGDNVLDETNASGAAVFRYVHGESVDEPLTMLHSTGSYFYDADGLGSVTSLANAVGTLVQTYRRDAFGRLTSSAGTILNSLQYAAREFDPEINAYFYRARYYDQNLGRFLSEDPIGFEGGMDFYAYVENSPIDLRDPWGLQAQPKPSPTATPIDPTPSRPGPVLVPKTPTPASPSLAERIFGLLGRATGVAIGVGIMILTSPMEMGQDDIRPNPDPNRDPSRKIKKPDCPNRGCTCTCRADADDTMPGNIKPGMPLFRFGTATAPTCNLAANAAKRIATRLLGMKPKHVGCLCTARGG